MKVEELWNCYLPVTGTHRYKPIVRSEVKRVP